MKRKLNIALALIGLTLSGTAAGAQLSVEQVPSLAPSGTMTGYLELGNRLLMSFESSSVTNFYMFDGDSFQTVANPDGAVLQRVNVNSADPTSGDVLTGMFFNQEYYFASTTPTGVRLFKTGDDAVERVAVFNASDDNESQRVSGMFSYGDDLYVRTVGPQGSDIYRQTGDQFVGWRSALGPDLTEASFRLFLRGQALIHARDTQTGQLGLYRNDWQSTEFVSQQLTGIGVLFSEREEFYWQANGRVYRYDGVIVAPVPEFDSYTSLNPAPLGFYTGPRYSDGSFITSIAQGPNGWAILTYDGVNLKEFDVDPAGVGSIPGIMQYLDGSFYFSRSGAGGFELFRSDAVDLTSYDVVPGNNPFSLDVENARVLDDAIYFYARGPQGKELYRVNETGSQLVADINPVGDAFPLTASGPAPFAGKLFFRAYSPATGDEVYWTDGTTTSVLKDIAPGPASSGGNYLTSVARIRDLNLVQISVEGTMGPFLVPILDYISDGESVWWLPEEVNKQYSGQSSGKIAAFDGALYFFSPTGQVFEISVVPEPATNLLAAIALAAIARRRSP